MFGYEQKQKAHELRAGNGKRSERLSSFQKGKISKRHIIQEIRGLLYERYDNKPKPIIDAHHFHYHVFGKILKEKIYEFSNKYGLYVNID